MLKLPATQPDRQRCHLKKPVILQNQSKQLKPLQSGSIVHHSNPSSSGTRKGQAL
jgi:hypothetical protein